MPREQIIDPEEGRIRVAQYTDSRGDRDNEGEKKKGGRCIIQEKSWYERMEIERQEGMSHMERKQRDEDSQVARRAGETITPNRWEPRSTLNKDGIRNERKEGIVHTDGKKIEEQDGAHEQIRKRG